MPGALNIQIVNNISYQETNLWEFYFLDIPPNLKSSFSSLSFKDFAETFSSPVIDFALSKYLVEQVSFGTNRPVELTYDDVTKTSYPSKTGSFTDLSVTFKETEDFAAYNFLNKLHNRIYDSGTNTFKSGDPRITAVMTFYKKSGVSNKIANSNNRPFLGNINKALSFTDKLVADIKYQTTGNLFNTGQVFILQGLILKSIGEISASYSEADLMRISSTFSVENVISVGLETAVQALSSDPITQALSSLF